MNFAPPAVKSSIANRQSSFENRQSPWRDDRDGLDCRTDDKDRAKAKENQRVFNAEDAEVAEEQTTDGVLDGMNRMAWIAGRKAKTEPPCLPYRSREEYAVG